MIPQKEVEAKLLNIETILQDIRKDQQYLNKVLFQGNGDSLITRIRMLEHRQESGEKESGRSKKFKDALTISLVASFVSLICSLVFSYFGG